MESKTMENKYNLSFFDKSIISIFSFFFKKSTLSPQKLITNAILYHKFITEVSSLEKELNKNQIEKTIDKKNILFFKFTEYMLNEVNSYAIKIAEVKDKLNIDELEICKEFLNYIIEYNKTNNYMDIEDVKIRMSIYIQNIDLIYKKYNIQGNVGPTGLQENLVSTGSQGIQGVTGLRG